MNILLCSWRIQNLILLLRGIYYGYVPKPKKCWYLNNLYFIYIFRYYHNIHKVLLKVKQKQFNLITTCGIWHQRSFKNYLHIKVLISLCIFTEYYNFKEKNVYMYLHRFLYNMSCSKAHLNTNRYETYFSVRAMRFVIYFSSLIYGCRKANDGHIRYTYIVVINKV